MKNLFQVLILVLIFSTQAFSQKMRDSQAKALDSLTKLKESWKATSNDSVFIAEHSHDKFRNHLFHRGDQEEDIEEQIYNAKPGDVVGPFRGYDSSNYLFKVIAFEEYILRSKANLIYIKAEGTRDLDTATVTKLALKYSEALKKGKDIKAMAAKDKVRLAYKDLKWYYENDMDKEYWSQVYNSEKGNAKVVKTSDHGSAIIYVTVSKEKTPYRVRLIELVKKG
ncbi:MAG: hypothetical protein K2X86_00890 [Cytophagaceae bacterium]|nr:hypothetical protein [Cytophagaceae bacterium]